MEHTTSSSCSNYQLILDAGTAFLVRELASVEKRPARKARKEKVLEFQIDQIKNLYTALVPDISSDNLNRYISGTLEHDDAVNFIIDLAFADPFAPYELMYSERQFNDALVTLGEIAGLTGEKVRKILATKREALQAHIRITDFKGIISWLARVAVVVVGGILVAPFIGATLIGLGTGFYGLSFINHVLSIIGMHTFDPVMAGHLGGQMVVRGVGNLSASMIRGAGSNIDLVSAASARLELAKLQVSFHEVLLSEQKSEDDALALFHKLETDRETLLEHLEHEKNMNESYSRRVRELEYTDRSMSSAIRWMRKKYDLRQR
jgi:hypothetical protein